MKALIPAAGLGTRFLPATKAMPKEMLLVVDRPVIQYVVEEGLASGADEVVIISNHDKKAIEEHFKPDPGLVSLLRERGKDDRADAVYHAGHLPVSFVYQNEPLGLGDAVHCAKEKTGDEPFFVLLGDVIVPSYNILKRMRKVSEQHDGASVIAVMPVSHDKVDRFGVIAGEEIDEGVWKVTGLVEKPPIDKAPSNMAVFGRYLLTPRVMEILETTAPGAGDEIQLTDAMATLLEEEEMYALVVSPDEGFDTGTVDTWLDTNNRLYVRRKAM